MKNSYMKTHTGVRATLTNNVGELNHQVARLLKRFKSIALLLMLVTLWPLAGQAQVARTVVNGGFEQFHTANCSPPAAGIDNPNLPAENSAANARCIVAWQSNDYSQGSNPVIEIWGTGFQGVNSVDGSVHFAEINAYQNASLTTEQFCAVGGETLNWNIDHHVRVNGIQVNHPADVMTVNFGNTVLGTVSSYANGDPGTCVGGAAACSSTPSANGWDHASGAYVVPSSGGSAFSFTAIQTVSGGSSIGNLIDNFSISPNLRPFVELIGGAASISPATNATSTTYAINITGVLLAPVTLTMSVSGTAVYGTDYDFSGTTALTGVSGSSGQLTVTIPAGTYDPSLNNTGFVLPIHILASAVTNGRTVLIGLPPVAPSALIFSSTQSCGATPTTLATYTIYTRADIAVSKSGPASVAPSAALTYTILVSNAGPSAADGSVFTDPAVSNLNVTGLSCGNPTGGASCPSASNDTVALMQGGGIVMPLLPSGGSMTFTVSGTSGASGAIDNQAIVAVPSGATDSNTANNTSSVHTVISSTAGTPVDLSITKAGPSTINPNGAISYIIVVSNPGANAANGALFQDGAVAGLSITSVTCGNQSGGAGCPATSDVSQMQGNGLAITPFPAGGAVTFTVMGTGPVSGSVTNTASVAAPAGTMDSNLGNNTASVTTTVTPVADLSIIKSGPASVQPNGSVTYSIVINNAGPSDASNAIFKDPLTANMTVSDVSCNVNGGGAVCPTGTNQSVALMQGTGIVIPTLPSGGNLTFVVTGNSANTSGFTNTATITAPTGVTDSVQGNNTSSVSTTIQNTANLRITKTGTPSAVTGDTVTYSMVIQNLGPSTSNGALFQDPALSNFTVNTVTCADNGSSTCPPAANVTIALMQSSGIVLQSLPASGGFSNIGPTFTVTGIAGTGTNIVNTATVKPAAGDVNPNPGAATSTANTTLKPQVDLAISKTGPASVTANAALSFTIVVSNKGPLAGDGATFTDPVVANFTATGLTCTAWTGGAVCPGNVTLGDAQGQGIVLPTLPNGSTLTFMETGNAGPSAGIITNTAKVITSAGTGDPSLGNNTANSSVPILLQTDLAITKTGPATVTSGGLVTYTIVLSNNGGPSAANGTIFTDALPTNLTSFNSVVCSGTTGGAACSDPAKTSVVYMTGPGIVIPTFPLGATVTFTVTGTAASNGSITNIAYVTPPSGVTDTNANNNTASFNTVIQAPIDLSVTKTGQTTVAPNTSFSYTSVVSNAGPSAVTGAKFTDPAVSNFTVTGVTCGNSSGGATCPTTLTVPLLQGGGLVLGNMPSGSALSFIITGTSGPTGSITNTVSVAAPASGYLDTNLNNNTATATTTTINPVADLSAAKSGPSSVNSNGTAIYTIVINNAGPGPANNAVFTDPVVANLSVTNVTCANATNGAACPAANATTVLLMQGSGGIVVPTLPANSSVTFTVTGTVGASGAISNVASVATPAGVSDPTPGNNSSTFATTINSQADLSVVKTGSTNVNSNDPVSYNIVLTNAGPAAANNALFTDPLPANMTAFTAVTCGAATGNAVCPTNPSLTDMSGSGIAVPTLPANGSVTFTVTGTAAVRGTIENTATVAAPTGVGDPTPANNTSRARTTITSLVDLSVAKSGSASVNSNGTVTYTILMSNAGPDMADGGLFKDPLPANLTAFTTVSCATTSGGAVCPTNPQLSDMTGSGIAVPTLPMNSSVTFTVTGTAAASGTISNTATAVAPAGSHNTSTSPTSTFSTPISAQADLSVVKTGTASVNSNGSVAYNIVLRNDGPAAANNATFTDPLPANMTAFTSVTCGTAIGGASTGGAVCPNNPAVGQMIGSGIQVPTLPAHSSVTFTVNGTAAASGTISNTASVAPPPGVADQFPSNNSSMYNTSINPRSGLSIVKTGSASVNSNGTVTYSIIVNNAGPAAADNAVFSDPLPANLTAFTGVSCVTSNGSAVCPSNPQVSQISSGITVPGLPANSSVTFTVTGTAAPSGTINNIAKITPPTGTSDPNGVSTSSFSTSINAQAYLAVAKTGDTSVNSGGTVTYHIVLSNTGPAAANNALFTDPRPTNMTAFTAVTCATTSGGAVCPTNPSLSDMTGSGIAVPTLPANSSVTFTVTGTAAPSGSIANTATVAPPSNVTNTNSTPTSTANTTIVPQAGLSIVKTGDSSVNSNGTVTYHMVVSNAGPAPANNAVFTDPLPANLTAFTTISCASTSGSAVCPSNPLVTQMGSPGIMVPSLPANSSVTFTVTGTAAPSGTISNTATISPPSGTTNPNGTSSSTFSTSINAQANLSVAKTGDTSVNSGGTVTYHIVVSNTGPAAANNAVFSDPLPANMTAFTAVSCASTSGGAVCPASPGVNQIGSGIQVPTLPANSSVTFTVAGTAAPSGSIANTATVAPPTGVTNTNSTPTSTANTSISAQANLSVVKTGTSSVNSGGAVTYTIVVSNAGPAAANNAVFSDPLPANMTAFTAVSCASTSGGAVCPASPGVNQIGSGIQVPTLPANSSVTFTVTGTAAPSGSIANTATVAPPTGVTNTNSTPTSTANTSISAQANLSVVKTGTSSVNSGGTVTYTIVVSNAGPAAANNALFSDPLPANMTAFTALSCASTSGGAVCPASPGVSQIGSGIQVPALPANSSVTFTVTGTAAPSGSITNTATVAPPSGVTNTNANPHSTATTAINAQANLSVVKTGPASVTSNGSVVYTIVMSNAGPAAANNAVFTDPAVANVTVSSVTCGAASGSAACASNANTSVALMQGAGIVVPSMPAGGSVTFTVTGTAGVSGSIANTATVATPSDVNNTNANPHSTATTPISAQANLTIAKTGPASVNSNGSAVYSIVIGNAGPAAADNTRFTDPAVANLTVSAVSCGAAAGSAACPSAAGTTVALMQGAGIAVPSLPAGGSVTFTVTGTVSTSGAISNVASLVMPAGLTNLNPSNSSTALTTINALADLSVLKTGPATVDTNSAAVYTIVVGNNGPAAANGAILTDPAVNNLAVTSVVCSNAAGGAACPSAANTTVALLQGAGLVIPTLPSGASLSFTVTGTTGASGSISNTATLATPDGVTDPTPGNNSSTVTSAISSMADVYTAIGNLPASVVFGQVVSGTVTFGSNGPASGTGMTYSMTLGNTPLSGVTFALMPGWTASYNPANSVVTFNGPRSLAAKQSVILGFSFNQPASQVKLSSVVATATPESRVDNNAATMMMAAPLMPAVLVSKSGDRTTAELGEMVKYTVNVQRTDQIPVAVAGYSVVDTLPSGFRYQPGTARLGGVSIADPLGAPGPQLNFLLGQLNPGAMLALTYRVRLGAGASQGSGINRAHAALNPALPCGAAAAGCSNEAAFKVTVKNGVFSTDACIAGKIFVDRNSNSVQDAGEPGIPAVRLYLESGAWVISDGEGKYSLCGIQPKTHVLKVDLTTLPAGSHLVTSSNRNAGDANSLFVDTKDGELQRADFVEGSGSERVLNEVAKRRAAMAAQRNDMMPQSSMPLR